MAHALIGYGVFSLATGIGLVALKFLVAGASTEEVS